MLVNVSPTRVTAVPGSPAVVTVSVTNTGSVIAGYSVDVLGVDPAWVTVDGGPLSLFPGDAGTVILLVELPADSPAGIRQLVVQVRDLTRPDSTSVTEVAIEVPARHATSVAIDPPVVSSGREASVGVILENNGNGPERLQLVGVDEDEQVRFDFEPASPVLEVGQRTVVTTRLRAKRPLTGSPKIRVVRVEALMADGTRAEATGSFIQKPLLSRGVFGLLGLLVAISVFAAVIATTFGRVADRSTADRNLLLDAISGEDAGAAGTPGSITGTITLLTSGEPVGGVTVDAYSTDDLTTASATTATDTAGGFVLPGLAVGKYKVRARGAGFIDVWYPLALDPKNADEIEVKEGAPTPAVDIRVGGVPASMAGTVRGEKVAGAAVNVRVPAGAVPGGTGLDEKGEPARGPVVASATVDASGQFAVADIPSPATYEVTAELEGFAVQSQLINLAAAEERSGVTFQLVHGDGTISGHIKDANGPLGSAVVTATSGATSVKSVSLTRDDIGGYTLRDLPTPATYTLVITHPGYTTATLSVNLGAGGTRTGVDTTLTEGAGSIAGIVSVSGVGPTGGVRVRATDGEHVVETVSLSQGTVGSYLLSGLAVPGTYTVSFERADLAPQTRAVTLDRFSHRNVTGQDVSLITSTGSVFGVVRDTDNLPVGNVTVTLTGNGITLRTTSATGQPPDAKGSYDLRGIPAGVYSLSFVRGGSAPTALLVTITAGGRLERDAVLVARATISGLVWTFTQTDPPTIPLQGARVRAYLQEEYGSPGAIVRATSVTGVNGEYNLPDLEAPNVYVLDFYANTSDVIPETSRQVPVQAGEDVTVPLVTLGQP